jgi:putative photosynthetic complex assembly protein
MNAITAEQKLPRGAIQGAGFMVVSALVLVGIARLTGYTPAQPPVSTVVDSFALRFEDRADGAVLVYDTADDQLTYTIEPGTNGFVRGVLRGLVRERRADHIGPTPPFRLTRWADGRLSLDDPSTGRHVDLEVFGPTNAGDFAAILLATAHHENKS